MEDYEKTKNRCEACGSVIIGNTKWSEHIETKGHKKKIFYYNWKEMLAAYYEEELQFLEFNRLVSVKGNDADTFSIRLYNILQSVCGQFESMMKILCDKLELLEATKPKFPQLFKLLNEERMLTRQEIYSIKTDHKFHPLNFIEEDKTPFWWKKYNDTKHNLPEGFKSGNIGNTLWALAGLYALHCIAYTIHHSPEPHSVLKKEGWYFINAISQDMYDNIGEKEYDPRPKSELFYNLSKFNLEGAPI